jgi:hypothetical protein
MIEEMMSREREAELDPQQIDKKIDKKTSAEVIFQRYLRQIQSKTDRLFAYLMLV